MPVVDPTDTETCPTAPTQTVGPRLQGMPGRQLQPGDLVAGRYEIVDPLGTGGYGVVYRVHDRRLDRDVALKVLRPDRLSESSRIRLRREVQVARDVACPQLVRVYDLGEDAELTWVTMELVEGETLRDRLRRGPPEIDEAVRIAREILLGLAKLHERGIVHRDVKPGNVLLAADGAVKLGDFGLARHWDRDETRATDTSSLVGTVEYVSPEQALGEEVGPRSDLYGLGVVLFEMLAGRLPHEASSSLGTVLAHIRQRAEDVRRLRPQVPAWLAAVVARLLEKEPVDRFAGAQDVLEAITARRLDVLGRFRRRRVRRGLLVAALLAVALVLAGWWLKAPALPQPRFNSAGLGVYSEGRLLWQKRILGATVARLRHGDPPRLVGFLPRAGDPSLPELTRMMVFDLWSGTELGSVETVRGEREFLEFGFSDSFGCDLTSKDLDGDGIDEIFGDCLHRTQWPSYSFLFEPRYGRSRVLMASCGHHYVVGDADVDGDGILEVLLLGINNCMGWKRGLAAVKLEPPVDVAEGHPMPARAPGDLFPGYTPESLLWYVLLPEDLCNRRDCVHMDQDQEVIRIEDKFGGTEEIGFDGFREVSTETSLPGRERSRHRRMAYWQVYHARRLMDAGSSSEALDRLREAADETRLAKDDQLLEWIERLTAQTLAEVDRIVEAQELFQALVVKVHSPGDVAYDAATAFHLAGRLDLAADWYRQALTGDPMVGRFSFEAYFGLVLALTESGSLEEAHLEVERLDSPQQPLAQASCRAYVHWRMGEPLELPIRGKPPMGTYDLFRYWNLEFRHYQGEPASTLLPDVLTERAQASEEFRGLVRALEAELLFDEGRVQESLDLVRDAHRLLEADLRRHPVARAHYDIVANRRAAIERAAGNEEKAVEVEETFRLWQSTQRQR